MDRETASVLLQREQDLAEEKKRAIADLLLERDDIQKHDDRQGEISADLKALGYTYPRKPREAKQEPSRNPEIAENDMNMDPGSPWSETGAGNPVPEPSKKKKK